MTISLTGLALMLAAVGVESFAQLFLKFGAAGGPATTPVRNTIPVPLWPASTWIALGVGAYVIEVALYTAALRYLDVSVAFPLGSLCFVGVAALSRLVLGERMGRMRLLGVLLVLCGATLVAL